MLLVAKNIISDSNLFFYLYNFSQSTTFEYNSAKMTVEQVKKIIFRYVMIYYNRKRISTVNPGGWPPTVFREKSAVACTAA